MDKTDITSMQHKCYGFGQKCKQEIIDIVSKCPDKAFRFDEDGENAWALVDNGAENAKIVEVRIVEIDINDEGKIVLVDECGDKYTEGSFAYEGAFWPDILLVVYQNLEYRNLYRTI